MTDVVSAPQEEDEPRPPLPKKVSSLRTRPAARRVPTANRVTIAIPKPSPTSDVTSAHSASGAGIQSPELNVTSTPWSKKLILTLDGGGIKGYSSLIVLQALMQEIARVEQDLDPRASSSAQTERIPRDQIPEDVFREDQYLPCHYFDYIAGTSVGGLIAIMLGMLGKSVDECISEFHRQNKNIPLTTDLAGGATIDFPLLYRRSTWPTKRTRAFFDTFAKFSVSSTTRNKAAVAATFPTPVSSRSSTHSNESTGFRKDVFQCQTLAWCTEVERHQPRRPYAFCTYKEEEEDDAGSLVSIPEVAKAITAPSSYSFKPFKLGSGSFVDGSKQIRDPTLEVLKEISSLLDDGGPSIDLLLSLGTDEHQAWFYEKLRAFTSSASTPLSANSTASRESLLDQERGKKYKTYYRFEAPDVKLGMRKKYYLSEIEEATREWLSSKEQKEQIARYARWLVQRRRERARTTRWEGFALGVRYVCHHGDCKMPERVWESRGDYYDHLERRHGVGRLRAEEREGELDKGRRFGVGDGL
ncbi:hypothetical protein QC762_408880 [Podospora pseudocomata]|uniref:PNPLA domain-containing protein n=1 Tax=Podospora pseudocomata TaxID=2093779 RepID=A0ABR0GFV6_9PEZI|nr:hypothetical protein QC762_408880 [Podospora pseudocomata]